MTDEEILAEKHRRAQRDYARTDKGRARARRVAEERQQGYALLRAQGVPRAEAKRRARQALREWLASQQQPAENETEAEVG